jgi:PAS domain S-box-containing protein
VVRASGSLSEGEQFRRLVEGVTDYAIYMLDPGGRVVSWNTGAQRIKGYRPEEILGLSFSTFYTEADRVAGEPQRALAIATTEGRFEKEALRVRKDGTEFWAHVIIDAIRDPDGTLVGFAKITRDITERVNAQKELDRAREELFQSQKMEAIGQLTGGVAHDFNNLLMAVLGSLELLRKRLPTDDPKLLQLIENAELGANRGRALTQRMLAFARRQELELKPVDLGKLLPGMSELIGQSLGPQFGVKIVVADNLPLATTDANKIENALLNLAVNARDAMPSGGAITIGAEEVLPPADLGLPSGRYVQLSVADDGMGMDEETRARAAEPFFTTKGVGKGTGLGLSMVHGLAEQSGGRMSLESQRGHGTTVSLWLPVSDSQQNAPAALPGIVPTPVAYAETRPLRIVAVDDDPLVLMNTTAMLEDMGHTVIDALSGQEALQKLEGEEQVDMVITDHAMPMMTGSQLAQQIRARWPAIPVVLATGYAELPPGGDEGLPKLSKPFSQAELEKVVRRAVQPAPVSASSQAARSATGATGTDSNSKP